MRIEILKEEDMGLNGRVVVGETTVYHDVVGLHWNRHRTGLDEITLEFGNGSVITVDGFIEPFNEQHLLKSIGEVGQ